MSEPSAKGGSEPHAIYCRMCGRATKGGKPVCPRHVTHMPYVRKLLAKLEARCVSVTPSSQHAPAPRSSNSAAGR